MEEEKVRYCPICKKPLKSSDSYTFKDGRKDTYCKNCRLIGCFDNQPWTYFPVMQLFDIPYIEYIWFDRIMREIKIATNTHVYGNIFGKYYSTMKLFHWKQFGFKDSRYINKNERKMPFTYKSKLPDMRYYFLDHDIPQEYYDIIGLNDV